MQGLCCGSSRSVSKSAAQPVCAGLHKHKLGRTRNQLTTCPIPRHQRAQHVRLASVPTDPTPSEAVTDPDVETIVNQTRPDKNHPPMLSQLDDEDRETFVTSQGLVVEEVEEEDASVSQCTSIWYKLAP